MAMTWYTDWKFVGAGRYGKARGLLKYLEYREDRVKHAPRAGGPLCLSGTGQAER